MIGGKVINNALACLGKTCEITVKAFQFLKSDFIFEKFYVFSLIKNWKFFIFACLFKKIKL